MKQWHLLETLRTCRSEHESLPKKNIKREVVETYHETNEYKGRK